MKSIPLTPELFEGVVSLETGDGWIRPWRLPFEKVRLFPPDASLPNPAGTPGGARLYLRTDAETIRIAAEPVADDRLFDVIL